MNDKGDRRASSNNGGSGERVEVRRRGPGRRKSDQLLSAEHLTETDDARLAALNLLEEAVDAREVQERLFSELRVNSDRTAAILESAIDSLITMDHEGRIVDFNPAAEKTFGHKREDVVGRTVAEVIIPERLREAHGRGLKKYLLTGEQRVLGRRMQMIALRSDGTEFPVELSITAVRAEGRPPFFTAFVRDITERTRAEELLLASEARLRAMTDNMGEGLYTIDVKGRVTSVNREAERLLGWRADKLIGRPIHDVIHHSRPDGTPFPVADCPVVKVFDRGEVIKDHDDWFIRRDGSFFPVRFTSAPMFDGKGDLAGLVVVFRDVTDRQAIEQQRAMLAAIVTWSEDAIVSKDLTGVIRTWNAGAERLFGYTAKEAVGKNITLIIPVDRLDEEPRILERIRAGEVVDHFETVRRRKDGSLVDISLTISPMKDAAGRIIGASKVARDITERKTEERRLTLLAGLGEKIRLDTEPETLLYDIAEVVGKHFGARRCFFNEIDLEDDVEIVHRDYVDRASSVAGRHKVSAYSPQSTAEMAAGKTVVNNDSKTDPRTAKFYKKTYGPAGERAYVAIPLMRDRQWVASMWLSTDEPRVWTPADVGALEMIAERAWLAAEKLRNDAAMRLSQERFARFMANLPGLAWIKSAEGSYVFANDAAAAAFDVPSDRLIGKTDDEIFSPETAAVFKENDQKVVRKKKPIQTVESLEHDDGTLHYSIVNKFPIPGPAGEPPLVGGMAIDITEQRRAEEEVRRISRMPAENPHPVMRITPEGEILYANDAARPLLKFWQRESGLAVPRDMRIRFHEAFRVGIRQDFEIEYDGRTVAATIAPITDAGYINFYAIDITDRKLAEEALREKEAELQLIADTTPLILARCSRDLRYQFINKAGADVLGLPIEKIVGRPLVDVMGKEAFAAIEPHVQDVLAGKRVEYEVQVPYRTGPRWMRVNYVPEHRADGTVTGWLASIVDITERKEAEQQLTEAQERFRLAQQAGQVGIFDWHIQAGRTYWSEAMWAMYGIEQNGVNPDERFWRSHLHPADRDRVIQNLRGSVESGDGEYREEFRIVRRDGSVRWIGATGRVIRDGDARPLRMFGVNIDITERKHAEERVRLSQNQLRLITDGLPALISYVNKDERYVYANRTYLEWFGIEPKDVVGRSVRSVFGISAYRKLKPSIDDALAGREARFEALIPYKKGGPRYVVGTYVPDVGADGKVRGYFGLTNDLTDLKRSRELLRSSEERLSLLMETFTDYAIISLDRDGRVESWNTGAEHIFGYTRDEMAGQTCDRLFTPEDLEANVPLKEMHQARLRGRASDERWLVRKDGSRFYASGVMMPLYVGKTLAGYAKIAGDLTEKQKQAELLQQAHDVLEERVAQRTRELAASNSALLAEIDQRAAAEKQRIDLLGRLVSSQEFERRRIARDLHDQLGQRLTALRLKLASLADAADGNTLIGERVARLQEIGERLDREVSFLAWELRPSALDDLGLIDAVAAYVNEWSRHYETDADFHSAGLAGSRFDHDVETHLYRVAQEALNNIAKHAGAARVSVLLDKIADNLVLIIEDDGKGFDPTAVRVSTESGSGLGLTGMKERAALIGGDLDIESAPGKGTTIYVRVPVFG